MKETLALVCFVLTLSGCETLVTPRYSISADTNVSLRALNATGVGVGPFTGPAEFDTFCRAYGPLVAPDNLTHTAYIRKALEDELKIAGAFAQDPARIILTGTVAKLEFSSTRGLTGGSWTIDLTVSSSNGTKAAVSEYYEFHSGFGADTACRQTAEAFMPAVQNLLGNLVRSAQFNVLLR